MGEVIDLPDLSVPPGLYTLADLPQRGSVEKQAFGAGWHELDQILKFYLGQFLVVTGIAGHGKSTFMLNVILKMALEQSVGSFLYVPENEGHLKAKLRKIWTGSQTAFDHFCRSQCTVQSAVPHQQYEPAHTIEWVLGKAQWAVEHRGAEIIMIDPWNELDRARQRDEMMTDYIGRCLMLIKDFCRTMNAIVIVVAHPTKAIVNSGNKVVSLADIEGSMNWYNKCDNGLIVVREAGNTAKVISAKVREIGAGKIGSCSFYVDPLTGQFTPQYASDHDVA
ncbi:MULTISPECIES: AAA family ATPase [unclassified Bradyrhizobium]|uniref:AAA family ATPase n=1 Tax=unclassified Bradyrhizobium TaxID=2631580 RepID=UPI0024797C0F|nr:MULTISPECIES: AAA family ATPase [unclassified Bradyrhizobium]WGR74323.1 AAA family ATPase [Bradyrhizobium sp. ISRA426]WGR79158.1 AAA family ATPase [Bradyrhizobium sp. ISRA430]WGR90645.1 AAA family ATPase [Bradyrhizobium sp. ISRA432]